MEITNIFESIGGQEKVDILENILRVKIIEEALNFLYPVLFSVLNFYMKGTYNKFVFFPVIPFL